jgi:phage terminase large subunit-like protein
VAGRGYGKTRSGAEETAWRAVRKPRQRICILAPTFRDVRETCIEGDSGILQSLPPTMVTKYNRSTLEIHLTNGSKLNGYSAAEPGRLRGPQFDFAWADEMAQFRYLERGKKKDNPWDMLEMAVRLGSAQIVGTTTPRPGERFRKILDDPMTAVTRGTTYENLKNLAPVFASSLLQYAGTTLGRQELLAELLDSMPGAIWTRMILEQLRLNYKPEPSEILVSVDPSTTATMDSDECGVVVLGKLGTDIAVVLQDASGRMMPSRWAKLAVDLCKSWGAVGILAEKNQGGEMVRDSIKNRDANIEVMLAHSVAPKSQRAATVQTLSEMGKLKLAGSFPELERQMTNWVPELGKDQSSPDRLDAMVQGVRWLLLRHAHMPSMPGVSMLKGESYS